MGREQIFENFVAYLLPVVNAGLLHVFTVVQHYMNGARNDRICDLHFVRGIVRLTACKVCGYRINACTFDIYARLHLSVYRNGYDERELKVFAV